VYPADGDGHEHVCQETTARSLAREHGRSSPADQANKRTNERSNQPYRTANQDSRHDRHRLGFLRHSTNETKHSRHPFPFWFCLILVQNYIRQSHLFVHPRFENEEEEKRPDSYTTIATWVSYALARQPFQTSKHTRPQNQNQPQERKQSCASPENRWMK
jgi:hypothetical protein